MGLEKPLNSQKVVREGLVAERTIKVSRVNIIKTKKEIRKDEPDKIPFGKDGLSSLEEWRERRRKRWPRYSSYIVAWVMGQWQRSLL